MKVESVQEDKAEMLKRLKIAVITSRDICYPTLRFPQYLDQDSYFRGLSAKAEVFLVGNILQPRPYASSQLSFTTILNKLPLAWNNRLAATLSLIPLVRKLRYGLDLFSDTLYTNFCRKFLSNSDVDAIYSFPFPFDRYVIKLARRLCKPVVIEMVEDYACFTSLVMTSLGLPRFVIAQEVRRIYKWMGDVANGADRVVVQSVVLAETLQGLGVEKEKIRKIPVCLDPSPPSDLQYIKEKHNLKDEEKVVFHIGGLAPWHDLFTLVKSIQYLRSRFVFIITGGMNKDLEQQAEHYSQGRARIIFTGRVAPGEVGNYLSLADICVAPYRFPQPSGLCPGKIIRYMLAGKAIVATDIPEIREMFQNREAGILVPQEDPEAWAEALDHLAGDSEERLRLGSIAKGIAENNYLTHHRSEQLTQLFGELV